MCACELVEEGACGCAHTRALRWGRLKRPGEWESLVLLCSGFGSEPLALFVPRCK